jgi:hypothetical protein
MATAKNRLRASSAAVTIIRRRTSSGGGTSCSDKTFNARRMKEWSDVECLSIGKSVKEDGRSCIKSNDGELEFDDMGIRSVVSIGTNATNDSCAIKIDRF